MAFKPVWCPVLQTHVTCVTDLEGTIMKVVCSEREERTHACRLKQAAIQAGPLSKLLEQASENTFTDRTLLCVLG